jgi:ABC-type Mn2+/Zn2+ transport system permease subunit
VIDAVRDAYALAPRAFQGGLLVAGACAAAGVLLRWRRLVWAGFAIPESAAAGTAAALALGALAAPLVFAATALAVAWLVPVARDARPGGERAAAACFLLATTAAVLLVSGSPHGAEEVRALATGKSLLFLGPGDVALLAWTLPPLALLAAAFAGRVAAAAFDRDHARVAGRRVALLEACFALGLLALVALSAPRAGPLLVFACLTLPAAAAERLAARPVPIVLAAVALALLGFLAGATAAVAYDLPFSTGAAAGMLTVAGVAWAAGRLARGA